MNVLSPFVLRSYDPPLDAITGATVGGVRRVGKRLVIGFESDLFLVIHLMIAGRLRWREAGQKPGVGPKMILATFEFAHGTLLFTEASSENARRCSSFAVKRAFAPSTQGASSRSRRRSTKFRAAIARENHTVKRTLTDPHVFSGIGNAYSDEILHAASLAAEVVARAGSRRSTPLRRAATTLTLWIARLRRGPRQFPEKVTAFREGMAVHGRYKQPCPVCGTPVQRIVYADNECNYCARCQTGGKLLADRSLSRLLKDDWPKSIDDL